MLDYVDQVEAAITMGSQHGPYIPFEINTHEVNLAGGSTGVLGIAPV
jgi:hypothetical protein